MPHCSALNSTGIAESKSGEFDHHSLAKDSDFDAIHSEQMSTTFKLVLSIAPIFVIVIVLAGDKDAELVGSRFTGETLTLLFVTDVSRSVAFYKALGFVHDYYYDYEEDHYTRDWSQTYPPQYAEVIQGKIRIGLTTADKSEQIYGGGVRHYFLVDDVQVHFAMVIKNGIVPEPNEVEERPWMNFFTVADPDNHQIVFGTKNHAYYDRAREQLEHLEHQLLQKQ